MAPVGAADIDAAARVVAPFAVRTPLLSFPVLNERVGTKVFLKPEMLQRTGSFKFRGAFNKLSSIPQAAHAAAWSRSRPATTPRAWPLRRRYSICRRPS
jgi:threonine dehydratase